MIRRIPFRLIGLLLLAYILFTLDLSLVLEQFRSIGAAAVTWAAMAFVMLLAFRCWRWHVLLQATSVPTSFSQNIVSCNASIWVGMATPGRVGEFRRATDLANEGALGLGQASALVLFELALDLAMFATFAVTAWLLLIGGFDAAQSWTLFSVLMIVTLALLAIVGSIVSASLRLFPALGKIPGVGSLMPRLAEHLDIGTGANIASLTLGVALAYVIMMIALIEGMLSAMGFLDAVAIVGLAGVAGAIPITYFGLGTRDVALIWYFAELGQSKETAVAVSFAFLLAQLIGIAVSLAASLVLPGLLRRNQDDSSH